MTRRGYPIDHVSEPPVEPRFARRFIAPRLDELVLHVHAVAAAAGPFLFQPHAGTLDQIRIASRPGIVAVRQIGRDAAARGFEGVIADHVSLERREVKVPIDEFMRRC